MNTPRWVAQNEDGTYAVGEGDAEIATCKNREDAMRLKEANAGSVAWLVTEYHINELQIDSIQRLIDRAKRASMTDIKLRINGQDEWYEADWLKHMTRTTSPQREEKNAAVGHVDLGYGWNEGDIRALVEALGKVRDGTGLYLCYRPADVFQDWFLEFLKAAEKQWKKEKNT